MYMLDLGFSSFSSLAIRLRCLKLNARKYRCSKILRVDPELDQDVNEWKLG
jgi:hypothetical protein